MAFIVAAVAAGVAGGLYAYFKGSVFPTYMAIPKSVDALLMVLLGGVQTVSGPIVGAFAFAWLQDWLVRAIADYWRFVLGAAIVRAGAGVPAGPRRRLPQVARARRRAASRRRRRRDEHAAVAAGARGSRKAFGGVKAVDGVSFGVEAGRLLALIGPNGAGKTTCFNLLNGQLAPDAGRVVLLEAATSPGCAPRAIWRLGVGRTFQITATFASMTVRENVQMALLSHHGRGCGRLVGRARDAFVAEADALLGRVGMAEQAERACGVLAYGDLKRVELAVALANAPKLLLMDEPTAGMAPARAHRADGADRRASRASRASPCCSPSTTWTSCSPTPTASSCSTAAG